VRRGAAQNRHAAAEHAAAADRAQPLGATALGFRRHSLSPADGERSARRVPVAGAATGCTAAVAAERNASRHTVAEHAAVVDHAAARLGSARLGVGGGECAPPTARGTVGPNRYDQDSDGAHCRPAAERNASCHAEHAAAADRTAARLAARVPRARRARPTDVERRCRAHRNRRRDSDGAHRRHAAERNAATPSPSASWQPRLGCARRRGQEASAPHRRRVGRNYQALGQQRGVPPPRRRSATRAATPPPSTPRGSSNGVSCMARRDG
jgi:hypothetical protein